MEELLLKILATGGDVLIWFIAFGFWKVDRRLVKLETKSDIIQEISHAINRIAPFRHETTKDSN